MRNRHRQTVVLMYLCCHETRTISVEWLKRTVDWRKLANEMTGDEVALSILNKRQSTVMKAEQ